MRDLRSPGHDDRDIFAWAGTGALMAIGVGLVTLWLSMHRAASSGVAAVPDLLELTVALCALGCLMVAAFGAATLLDTRYQELSDTERIRRTGIPAPAQVEVRRIR